MFWATAENLEVSSTLKNVTCLGHLQSEKFNQQKILHTLMC